MGMRPGAGRAEGSLFAANNPVTGSDASGLVRVDDSNGGGTCDATCQQQLAQEFTQQPAYIPSYGAPAGLLMGHLSIEPTGPYFASRTCQ
jgi:hypothetical protein